MVGMSAMTIDWRCLPMDSFTHDGCSNTSNMRKALLSQKAAIEMSPKNSSRGRRSIPSSCVLFLILLVTTRDVSCLAVSEPSSSVRGIVSTKTDSGVSKTFLFDEMAEKQSSKTSLSSRLDHARNTKAILRRLHSGFRSTFLPSGFPYKTPSGYLSFSVWSWIQDLSTQLRSVLATQRVLEGVGVGREGATALSALMNYLVRDGCGMGASLLFTSVASSRFKSDVKRWRLFADLMVDLGITLEVAATAVPSPLFLPMISVGNMCKAVCGVAAGACGGAINLHWARGSDISDINAKFGAQMTVTGSLGLVFAALFARSVSAVKEKNLWILYSILTALHIFANMQCMRLVAFDSLNTARMNLVAAEFFQWWDTNQSEKGSQTTLGGGDGIVAAYKGERVPLSSPEEIAKKEPLFFFPTTKRTSIVTRYPIYFGVAFDEFSRRSQMAIPELEKYAVSTMTSSNDNYLIAVRRPCRRRGYATVVSLSSEATPRDEAKAYFHALLLNRQLGKVSPQDQATEQIEKAVAAELEVAWTAFEKGLSMSGWDLSKTVLRTAGYEISLQTRSIQ